MTTANHLLNVLAGEDREQANEVFSALIQDKVADALEVAKVEIASSIMGGEVVEESLDEAGKVFVHQNIYSAGPHKHTHQVVYTTPDYKKKQYFHVTADDEEHAKEQLMNAEPTAKIHDVNRININEGEGMDAQRRWVRQVAAIGKEGSMKPMHRDSLKAAARKYFQTYKPHGAAFVEKGAQAVKGARQMLKQKRLQGEETVEEGLYRVVHSIDSEGPQKREVNIKARDVDHAEEKFAKKVPNGRIHKVVRQDMEPKGLSEGGPTRKHFQQVADLIKEIPDAAKRKELAQHHAGIFKQQNPRFDHGRFYKAAGVEVNEALEPGSKPQSNGTLNRNVTMNIRRAVQALNLKGINPQMASQGHRDFTKLAMKNPKAPGYMLLRKLAPNKASAVQGLSQAGVPLGGALDANPTEFNQVLQRIKRFK